MKLSSDAHALGRAEQAGTWALKDLVLAGPPTQGCQGTQGCGPQAELPSPLAGLPLEGYTFQIYTLNWCFRKTVLFKDR